MNKTLLSYLLIIGIAGVTGSIGGYVAKKLLGGVDTIIIGDPEAFQDDSAALLQRYEANPNDNYSPSQLVNIGLEKYRNQENSYSYSVGIGETVVSQDIRNYQIKNGDHYFEESISTSSMVSLANRVYQNGVDGDIEFYKGKSVTNESGSYPESPRVMSKEDYKSTFGKTPDRMFIYILSDQSVIENECSVSKSDGKITVKLSLDPDKATYNYKLQMMNISGLDNLPVFQYLKHEYIFDSQMNLLQYTLDEEYDAQMMVSAHIHALINVKCFPGQYLKIPGLKDNLNYTL